MKVLCYFLLLLLGGYGADLAAAENKKILIVADPWCPLICDPAQGKRGFIIDTAEMILSRAGYHVDYQMMNWARSVRETREGKANAIAGAYKTDAKGFILPEAHQSISEGCFFAKTKFRYKGPADLKGKRIGIVQDYTYGPPLDAAIAAPESYGITFEKISGIKPIELNMQKLLNDRIDAMTDDKMAVDYYLAAHPEIKGIHSTCYSKQKTYLAFSPHPSLRALSKKLAALITAGMRDPKLAAERQAILARYGIH